jgi:hypothetical protein
MPVLAAGEQQTGCLPEPQRDPCRHRVGVRLAPDAVSSE